MSTVNPPIKFDRGFLPPPDPSADTLDVISPSDGTEASLKPAMLYLDQLAPEGGRSSQMASLNGVARRLGYEQKVIQLADKTTTLAPWQQLDWRTLNAANIASNILGMKAAPGTRNRTLSAFRGVARFAWYLRDIDDHTYFRIHVATRRLHDKGYREPIGRALLPLELQALVKACETDPRERRLRDIALFLVASCTGFRRKELANITLSNIERTEGAVRITVIGKGNREHHAYVVGNALKALDAWLVQHANRGEYVFCPVYPYHQPVTNRPLSMTNMDKILHYRSRKAGIRKVNWHDFRRGVGSTLIDRYGLQDANLHLGHKYLESTRRYDRRGDRVLIKTAQFLDEVYGYGFTAEQLLQ